MGFGLPSTVRACLFDLDGVLTPTATVHASAWKAAFDAYLSTRARATEAPFIPFDAVGDYDRYVDGRSRVEGARAFLVSRGLELPEGSAEDLPGAETVRELANRKNEVFERLLREERLVAYAGSVRYVRAVRGGGLCTAVVSSSRHCRQVLAAAGIANLFGAIIDGVVVRERKLAGKPAPDTYLAAARALDFGPAQSAVFEDALAGVDAGRAGRFGFVVGVDRVGHSKELRRHGADIVVTDLAELLEAK